MIQMLPVVGLGMIKMLAHPQDLGTRLEMQEEGVIEGAKQETVAATHQGAGRRVGKAPGLLDKQ